MARSIQEVKSVADVWPFVQECMKAGGLWTELIHGGRHMRHVLREAETLIAECQLGESLVKCLCVAAAVHDLGRLGGNFQHPVVSEEELKEVIDAARIDKNNSKYVDHAHLSAHLFRLMPIEDLTDEEKTAVFGAVRDHSVGLVGKFITRAETLEEKILGLLVVADHCGDAASPDGAARSIRALKGKPVLSNVFSVEHLWQYVQEGCPVIPVADANKYKNESLVAHQVYNYQASWPILAAVRHLLSQQYWDEEVMPRQLMYGSIIEPLLQLQESI